MSSGYGRTITATSTTDALKYLWINIDFLNSQLKALEVNYTWNFQYYSNKMNQLIKKITTTIPVKTSQDFKKKGN